MATMAPETTNDITSALEKTEVVEVLNADGSRKSGEQIRDVSTRNILFEVTIKQNYLE